MMNGTRDDLLEILVTGESWDNDDPRWNTLNVLIGMVMDDPNLERSKVEWADALVAAIHAVDHADGLVNGYLPDRSDLAALHAVLAAADQLRSLAKSSIHRYTELRDQQLNELIGRIEVDAADAR